MSSNSLTVNLKVLVMDTDYYALQAINSYLAWGRRTRVTYLADAEKSMWQYIRRTPLAELPDVVLLDAGPLGGPDALKTTVKTLTDYVREVRVLCLAQMADPELITAAAESTACAYLLKQELRSQIAWAIVYALDHNFLVTTTIEKVAVNLFHNRLRHATLLPEQREYPELTDRIRQAIELCVVKGMPAHLAADEMGISLHTIRSYIKEGYRILEAYDETEYPIDFTPQERAFMRFTRPVDK